MLAALSRRIHTSKFEEKQKKIEKIAKNFAITDALFTFRTYAMIISVECLLLDAILLIFGYRFYLESVFTLANCI